jgi:hypothetical protein
MIETLSIVAGGYETFLGAEVAPRSRNLRCLPTPPSEGCVGGMA